MLDHCRSGTLEGTSASHHVRDSSNPGWAPSLIIDQSASHASTCTRLAILIRIRMQVCIHFQFLNHTSLEQDL